MSGEAARNRFLSCLSLWSLPDSRLWRSLSWLRRFLRALKLLQNCQATQANSSIIPYNCDDQPCRHIESEPVLISAIFFISTPETAEKNKPTNFLRKYELWQLRFLGKIVNFFHDNMQPRYPLLIKFCRRETVNVYCVLEERENAS